MKFKLRSIWRSAELKALTICLCLIVGVGLVMVFPEREIERDILTPIRITSFVVLCIGALVGLKSIVDAFRQNR